MCNSRYVISIFLAATIVKIIVISEFYQNLLEKHDEEWQVKVGYTWDDYITALENDSYTVPPQKSLAGVVTLESSAYRPPIFPYLVFAAHKVRHLGPLLPVIFFSFLTSLVAWLSFRIVLLKRGTVQAAVAGAVVFLFPMNFLKSGAWDEAVIMLVFLLAALYLIVEKRESVWTVGIAGIFLGLAILTRFTALLAVIGIVIGVLLEKRFRHVLYLLVAVMLVLAPWIYRNYCELGAAVLSTGGARFGVVTSSPEFLSGFPEKSIDMIEIEYFYRNAAKYSYLGKLNEIERETALTQEYRNLIIADPSLLWRSFVVKMKVFLPLSYYPVRESFLRSAIYLIFYLTIIFMGLFRLYRFKDPWSYTLWFAALGYASQGVIFVMTSRHMYPVIVLVLVAFMSDFIRGTAQVRCSVVKSKLSAVLSKQQ